MSHSRFCRFRLFLLSLMCGGAAWAADSLPVPEGFTPQWEAQPEVAEGGDHARMVINGLWNFQPGNPERPSQPTEVWSWAWVPGSWHVRPTWNAVGVLAYGDSPLWKKFDANHREWPLGWYRRKITMPESWKGRRVFLEFHEVSTEARVWLDGELMGGLNAESGRVELTKGVKAGETQVLFVQVAAVPPNQPSLFLQGEMAEQVILKPAKLSKFGLVWDVELVTEPMGIQLGLPQVSTSVREKSISLSGEASEALPEGASLKVRILNAAGEEVTAWTELGIEGDSWITEKEWAPETFWDLETPEVLTAEVALLDGEKELDVRRVTFGFREIRIVGKDILLNEIPVRLRPVPYIDMPMSEAMVDQFIKGIKHAGFNTLMTRGDRGQNLFVAAADREGILILAELPEIKNFAFRGGWEEGKAGWEQDMRAELNRLYNHPSIVMWWSGFNVFAHGQDQNPRYLGQARMKIDHPDWVKRAAVGWEALDLIRAADPSRPVYSHNASALGDMQTVNTYLNLIPLQEREEWLSEWAENGITPYLACEFGTPLNTTFMQGKAGGGWTSKDKGAINSAAMVTENMAIYLGPEAYVLQTDPYQDMIRTSYVKGFVHNNWQGGVELINTEPGLQKLETLFNRNSFRSWRTWGTTGGMNPWSLGHGFAYPSWRKNADNIPIGPYKPGDRGLYRPEVGEAVWKNFDGGFEVLPAGEALLANNQPLLAYIGGDAAQGFTDKDHQFFAGDTLRKQVVLINDMRHDVLFEGTWKVIRGDQTLAEGTIAETLSPAENRFLPIEALLDGAEGEALAGEIHLQIEAEGQKLEDRFAFRQYPFTQEEKLLAESNLTVQLLAGDGSTRAWLEQVGVTIEEWDGQAGGVLIVGRGALDGNENRIAELRDWVRAGGKLWVSSPSTEWLTEKAGFRITPHPSRRVYATANAPTVFKDLDADTLRDWNGASTRVDGYPEYEVDELNFGVKPLHGWRWGNRGSVAYTMIEKPHHAGWIPWLEGEFDMAYSPLMVRPEGKGAVMVSTLDLEDQVGVDPAARMLSVLILGELRKYQTAERRTTAYLGRKEGLETLRDLGLVLDAPSAAEAGVVVLGRNHGVSEQQLTAWRDAGKRMLFLRRAELPSFTGWSWGLPEDHRGTLQIPDWPETAGLSVSDFHFRAPYPMWTLEGAGVAAEGLLARQGEGILATSIDPEWLRVDEQPFMRLTQWRHHRVLTQLLSGLGSRFGMDGQIFDQYELPLGRISLVGDWQLTATKLLPPSASPQEGHADAGISEAALAVVNGESNPEWETVAVPGALEQVDAWRENDGEFVYRLEVHVPEAWMGQELVLSLGSVDDADDTYWNGERIGGVGLDTVNSWKVVRQYTISADKVKAGTNVIHVRAFDRFGGGGIQGLAGDTHLRLKWGKPLSWYHADYREDFAYGDDPYRYYRW